MGQSIERALAVRRWGCDTFPAQPFGARNDPDAAEVSLSRPEQQDDKGDGKGLLVT